MTTVQTSGERTAPDRDTDTPVYLDAIDVHHHIVPPFYREALSRGGVDSPIGGVDFPEWDVESSLGMMDRQGISTAIVSVSVPGVPTHDRALAVRLARQTNEYMAGLAEAHPGRFGGFAVLPLPHVPDALDELEYALDVLGLDGVGLFTNYDRVYLGDPSLEPVLRELDRRGAVAFVHPGVPPAEGAPLVDVPASVCEFPFATTRMATQMLYNRTFERLPRLRLILPHAGGTIPYLAERLTFAPVIRPSMVEHAPVDPLGSLRTQYYDVAMSASPYALTTLRRFAATSQILVGTDFPFMPAWSSARNGRQLVEYGEFGTDELTSVNRGNAERLFPRFAMAGAAG
jgi:predicted TIM-barrel fold metal-dependent hydrolase